MTPAERGVLKLVIDGRSNAEAARERGVATRTVANQVSSLLRKLGAGSRRELAASAACDPLVGRRRDSFSAGLRRLTNREWQVAARAAVGRSNKWIAYELGVSVSTVATHLASGKRKLGLSSGTALARLVPALRLTGSGLAPVRSSI